MTSSPDPYQVLGLHRSERPSRNDIKRAFRNLALQYHPDLNQGPQAAGDYERIRVAAEYLLGQRKHPYSSISSAAGSKRSSWGHFADITRHPRFPLYFCGVCLVGGCIIFAGALHVHQDLYTYSVHQEAEQRQQNPSEGQRRIMDLLQEQREQRRIPDEQRPDQPS